MNTPANTPQAVLQHHLEAPGNHVLDRLIKHYTGRSGRWTPDGEMVGLEAISSFLCIYPPSEREDKPGIKKMTTEGNKIFIT